MSDPDDKSRAERPDTRPPSLFDSDWDTLLGEVGNLTPGTSGSRPIFAPQTSGLGSIAGIVKAADPSPRTSDDHASVSGEFQTPTGRPEPTTPPRYEPPPGIAVDDPHELDTAEHLVLDPTLDQGLDQSQGPEPTPEPEAKLAQVIELVRASSSIKPDPSADEPEPDLDSRATQPIQISPPVEAEVESESTGSSRGVVIVMVALAVIGLTVMIAKALGGDDESSDTVAHKPKAAPREPIADGTSSSASAEPSLETETETSGSATETETGEGDGGETETGEPEPAKLDPRDPKLIPPGTPKQNAEAFLKLPVSIHDGPPLGGIGRSGLHIDSIATASGSDNVECDDPSQRFSVTTAEYVNVCFRIVHPRGEPESLRIYWEKDGKVTRRSRVRIPELRAYATRAYLLLRPEYVGSWRIRIVPEDEEDIDLAVAEFEITE